MVLLLFRRIPLVRNAKTASMTIDLAAWTKPGRAKIFLNLSHRPGGTQFRIVSDLSIRFPEFKACSHPSDAVIRIEKPKRTQSDSPAAGPRPQLRFLLRHRKVSNQGVVNCCLYSCGFFQWECIRKLPEIRDVSTTRFSSSIAALIAATAPTIQRCVMRSFRWFTLRSPLRAAV